MFKQFRLGPIGLVTIGLLIMGQSCSINIGQPKQVTGGFFRSDDGGRTWLQKTAVSQTKKKTVTIAAVSGLSLGFDPLHVGTVYLGTRENGIWKTTNRGDRWVSTGLKTGGYPCLDFDPNNSAIVYTVSGTNIYKSTNAGVSWQVVYQESQVGHTVACVAVDPRSGNNVWAVTTGGKILLSQNFGQTWALKQTLPVLQVRRLLANDDGSGRLLVFASRGIYSIDGYGQSWTDLSLAFKTSGLTGVVNLLSVSVVGGLHPDWLVGTGKGALQSLNQGITWHIIPTLLTKNSTAITNVSANPENESEIFLTVGTRLHHTTDGGRTWAVTSLPTGLPPVLLTFDPNDSHRLYFSTLTPLKK